MKDFTEISKRIEQIKTHFRFSNQELGEICGVSYTAIANIINGITKDPGISLFLNLITKLEIKAEWLLLGKGDMLSKNALSLNIDHPEAIKFLKQENENLRTIILSKESELSTLKKMILLLEERKSQRNRNVS